MFNMSKIKAVNGAGKAFYLNHLSSNDYYSEHEQVEGCWRGNLIWDFDLFGKAVTAEVFSQLQRNINPKTMDKLTLRTVGSGVRFFDFQVAAPKSVSVMSLFDERLIEAHRLSVQEAMTELERLAAVRIRTGDNVRTNNYEITGKILYAEFLHDASRALDPQLHTHNVVANVTKTEDGTYKALESLEMCRAIRYAGKVYHNAMAARCREMGYETVNRMDEKGNIVWYDLKGVPEEVMELFSKRRSQIEAKEAEFIQEHGRKPTLAENNYLSISTRQDKLATSSRNEVRNHQLKQLSREQRMTLESLAREVRVNPGKADMADLSQTAEMIRESLPLIYERESVVKLDKVLAETLNQNLGKISLKTLKQAVKEVDELRDLGGGEANPYVSPEEVIERELEAIKLVEDHKELFEPIAPEFEAFPGEESREKQAKLIHGMLNSKDRFCLFRGVAGAGKTSTLQELCKGLRSGGVNDIYLVAPTNSATDVLKQEGFEQSQTVASFLLSPEKPPAGSYVIIDESGLNSLREGVEILKTARMQNYRVLFVGDARQHTAVESGDFFRLLEKYSKIERFSLTDIHRQQNEEYRRGIMACALGMFSQAFDRFDRNGFIHEGKGDYLKEAAQSYMDYTDNGRSIDQAILVAPTHDEGDNLTDAVRVKLKEHGAVAQSGREAEVFRSWSKPKAWLKNAANYKAGTTVAFIRNLKEIAHAGETATVELVDGDMLYLDNGKMVYAKNAADFIEVGEMRKIELCEGDLIQFNVNLRDRKIYNGNIARITSDPGKVMMLYSDGKPRELIDLPENYAAFKYGWVTTSHKSQGRTAENVVVAAQALDRKAFYVALSRGRKHMALHCPEKAFLKEQLSFRKGDRTSIHDLVSESEISEDALLPLSREAQEVKEKLLPDTKYKSIRERAAKLFRHVKDMLAGIFTHGRRIAARRARFARYGHGIVTEKTLFESGRDFAIDRKPVSDLSVETPGIASSMGNRPKTPASVATSESFETDSRVSEFRAMLTAMGLGRSESASISENEISPSSDAAVESIIPAASSSKPETIPPPSPQPVTEVSPTPSAESVPPPVEPPPPEPVVKKKRPPRGMSI